jgi:hypothetical protein
MAPPALRPRGELSKRPPQVSEQAKRAATPRPEVLRQPPGGQ